MAEQRQLMVMAGARLSLHGASALKQSWASLEGSVSAGATSIVVATPTAWTVDDVIVIASSTVDPRDAEVRRIVGVDAQGRRFDLDQALEHDHFGRQQSYDGKLIDTRAEVGLLSHNLQIEGDLGSIDTAIGGNVMIMNEAMMRPESSPQSLLRPAYTIASVAQIEGVSFYRMGQRGRAGRYALHWHLVDDGSESYIRRSAIHEGYQRAVVIHGTDAVLVEENVGYHVSNHMFVPSEEGDEVRNRFIGNLAILTLPVQPEHFAFPSSTNPSRSDQSEHRVAAFWLVNSFNRIHRNRAAGTYRGQGFFLDHSGMNQRSKKLAFQASGSPEICDFRDNLSHSNFVGLGSPDLYTPLVRGFGLFTTSQAYRYQRDPDLFTQCSFTGLQVYKSQNGGAWIENGTILRDAIVVDSHTGVISGDWVEDVVVVGQSENSLGQNSQYPAPQRSRGGFAQSNNGGQNIYGRRFQNLSCINLPTCFYAQKGSVNGVGQLDGASIDQLRLWATPQGFGDGEGQVFFDPAANVQFGTYTDMDGSLSGIPGSVGSIGSSTFMRFVHAQDNQFGWLWSDIVYPSGPAPASEHLFGNGFE